MKFIALQDLKSENVVYVIRNNKLFEFDLLSILVCTIYKIDPESSKSIK